MDEDSELCVVTAVNETMQEQINDLEQRMEELMLAHEIPDAVLVKMQAQEDSQPWHLQEDDAAFWQSVVEAGDALYQSEEEPLWKAVVNQKGNMGACPPRLCVLY